MLFLVVCCVREIIRRKAVLCLRAFIMKVPDLSSQLKPCLNHALNDKDPGVMWAAVEAYHHLIQACFHLFSSAMIRPAQN